MVAPCERSSLCRRASGIHQGVRRRRTRIPRREFHLRKLSLAAALVVISMAPPLNAQNVQATIQQAEAAGATRPHESAEVPSQSYFVDSRFDGTAARRCVSDTAYPSSPSGSLRSGDVIVRAGWGRPLGFRAGKEKKVLWVPLHGSRSRRLPLLLHAVRIGNPGDSVRFHIDGLAKGGGRPEPLYGYPSEVSFPTAGQWLVVATAGNDWGCFVFDVEPLRGGN